MFHFYKCLLSSDECSINKLKEVIIVKLAYIKTLCISEPMVAAMKIIKVFRQLYCTVEK